MCYVAQYHQITVNIPKQTDSDQKAEKTVFVDAAGIHWD